MTNLIAYVPVLNQFYIDWFHKHRGSGLFLISNKLAENLLPALKRNMAAVSTEIVSRSISLNVPSISWVEILEPNFTNFLKYKRYFLPDEDLCHLFADKYLDPGMATFELVWGRWDMVAIKRQEPIVPDLEVSLKEIDLFRMLEAKRFAQNSPDWWRCVAAVAYKEESLIAAAYNQHFPNEYEASIHGDPRLNFEIGDPAGAEVYLSLHAERGVVAECARKKGVALEGASVYVTTFPCGDCARLLAKCRIAELLFVEGYNNLKGLETLRAAGVKIIQVKIPEST